MTVKILLSSAIAVAFCLSTQLLATPAHADESAQTKTENSMDDAGTTAKKEVRKAKKQVRKSSGNDSTLNDAQDKLDDAKDDASNSARKAKRDTEQAD